MLLINWFNLHISFFSIIIYDDKIANIGERHDNSVSFLYLKVFHVGHIGFVPLMILKIASVLTAVYVYT